jgi:hypothetical protein
LFLLRVFVLLFSPDGFPCRAVFTSSAAAPPAAADALEAAPEAAPEATEDKKDQ